MRTRNNPVGVGCLLMAIVIAILAIIIVSCKPTKSTLKQQIAAQSEQISVLSANSEKQNLLLLQTEKQRDSVKQEFYVIEKNYFSLENLYRSANENSLLNSWYKEYYESGNLKSEGGTNAEKSVYKTEDKQNLNTADYKDKYLTLLSNSEHEHAMLLDYAYENDSLRQVIATSEQIKTNTQSTEKRGLGWWQKFLMWSGAAAWALLIMWIVWKIKFGK
jgi:cell division protein FtsL